MLATLILGASPAAGQCDPTLLGSVVTPTPGRAYGVAVSGTVAYVADMALGLQVIDVSDPANPTILGFVDTPGIALGVAVSGTLAYVADMGSGLQVIDVSDPANPAILGSVDVPEITTAFFAVAVSGTVAYATDVLGGAGLQVGGLWVIGVSDPANPTILGSVVTPGQAHGVAVSGTVAYVAEPLGANGRLQVIDVSDPANPTILGSVVTPGWAYGVAVSGHLAYVAAHSSGLHVIDVSDPANPTILGSVDTPGRAYGVAVSGTAAYVADLSSGLQVIDVSDPANPAILGSADTPGNPEDVAVSGTVAYVGGRDYGLQVIDVGGELTLDAEAPGDRFGQAVASAGDVDNDDIRDILVGAPYSDANGTNSGRVSVFSGRTGELLLHKAGGQPGNRLGWAVAGAGDVNGDGYADVIAGAPEYGNNKRGRVRVYSGRTGQVLYTKKGARSGDQFGYAVSGGVDIDNDDRDDFIVGAPFNDDGGTKAGKVYAYSGRSGARIGTLEGERSGDALGWSVAALRRANSDGYADFVVGAPKNDDRDSNAGKVYVVSGRDFTVLYTLKGTKRGDQFGRSITALGRVDGDNRDEFAVGSPYADKSSAANSGRVDVFSGRDGHRLWRKTGQTEGERYGWAIGAADVDGDGRRDILGAAPWRDGAGASAGRIYMRRGLTGASMGTVGGNAGGDLFGYALAGIGNLDADGIEEYAVGAPMTDIVGPNAGSVTMRYSAGCAGAPVQGTEAGWPYPGRGGGLDLLTVLSSWGECAVCPEDRNGDGWIDIDDVISVIESSSTAVE